MADVLPAVTDARIVWAPGDGLRVSLAGKVHLDGTDDDDRALFDGITPSRELELRVMVICKGASVEWSRDPDGDVQGVIATKLLSVQSVWASD